MLSALVSVCVLFAALDANGQETYPWSSLVDMTVPHVPLDARFESPNGFTRVALEEDSFGAFLRRLPVRMDRTYVRSHRGTRLGSPSAAVVLLDVGARDLPRRRSW